MIATHSLKLYGTSVNNRSVGSSIVHQRKKKPGATGRLILEILETALISLQLGSSMQRTGILKYVLEREPFFLEKGH